MAIAALEKFFNHLVLMSLLKFKVMVRVIVTFKLKFQVLHVGEEVAEALEDEEVLVEGLYAQT